MSWPARACATLRSRDPEGHAKGLAAFRISPPLVRAAPSALAHVPRLIGALERSEQPEPGQYFAVRVAKEPEGEDLMPVERDVQFLNIDLLLFGRFGREPLLAAMTDGVFVLHDDAEFDGEPCLMLEVLEPDLDFVKTLARLLKWVEVLPPRNLST
jgi:hypothetical protein